MTIILTVIITILIFAVLITIHELGHYLVARAFHVGVREFSIGMGPAIHTWKLKHNKFSIRWLPIGGYVSMIGEAPDDKPEPEDEGKEGLNKKPIRQRLLVVLAGPVMNIVLAFVVMSGIVITAPLVGSTTIADFPESDVEYTGERHPNSQELLLPEDKIVAIDGSRVFVYNDISFLIALRGKNPIDVTVIRNGVETVVSGVIFPEEVSGGIAMGGMNFRVYAEKKTIGEVAYQSLFQPISIGRMTVESLFRAVRGEYGWKAVSGPVGVGGQISDVVKNSGNFGDTVRNLLLMLVLISMSLGLCNLLPIPVLDGGHVVFYIIEAIRRKPLNQKVESVINAVFMIALLAFMAFVALKDIIGLF